MRHFVLFVIFCLFGSPAFAQTPSVEGYVLTDNAKLLQEEGWEFDGMSAWVKRIKEGTSEEMAATIELISYIEVQPDVIYINTVVLFGIGTRCANVESMEIMLWLHGNQSGTLVTCDTQQHDIKIPEDFQKMLGDLPEGLTLE